jgi:hypothetical protein
MINIKEDQLSKSLGRLKTKEIWSRGRRGTNYHSSRIILNGRQLKKSPKCHKHWEKGQGNNPLNVGVVREITCIEISLIEVKK